MTALARQRWRRLGRVFCADGRGPAFASHASYPTPLHRADGTLRIFFSPRDARNRSSIVFLDLALDGNRFEVLRVADAPVLTPGVRGAFDDSGVSVSSVVRDGDRLLVYYLGWSLSVTVPFRNFIGLAVGRGDGGPLIRHAAAPIVDRSDTDPFTLGYPFVLRDGAHWWMWYGSHLDWGAQGLDMRHVIKDAESSDGVAWRRSGRIALGLGAPPEFALSRPCVVRDPDRYRMWYSRRNPDYSIGYAESDDRLSWSRRDELVSFEGEADDWDRDCCTYPAVFDHRGSRYMLYNGNGYGRTGFGLAWLET